MLLHGWSVVFCTSSSSGMPSLRHKLLASSIRGSLAFVLGRSVVRSVVLACVVRCALCFVPPRALRVVPPRALRVVPPLTQDGPAQAGVGGEGAGR